MDLHILERVWPILAGLGYLLAVSTLSVLAAYRRTAISIHDRAREAKLMRLSFMTDRSADGEEGELVA